MTVRERLAWLDRAQGTLSFKIVASVIVGVLAAGAVVFYAVEATARGGETPRLEVVRQGDDAGGAAETEGDKAARSSMEAAARTLNDILDRRADTTGVAVGIGAAAAVALVIIWLGLGLTYLGLLFVTAAVVAPLYLWGGATARAAGAFIGAVVALTASFAALMQGLKLALGGPWPVTAIARNVVNEAVRLKVSLVFIVLLIFALAALPGLLDEENPLRYRVQSFLQYGTGGTFWIIAVLVLFLSTGTVSFEQRDRVIWQTMTKPVAAWEYLLGKWLGVAGVAAVLLAVSASGVFLFTEYLRNQRAVGEDAPYVASGNAVMSDDRLVLESQVLAARKSAKPRLEPLTPEQVREQVEDRVRRLKQLDREYRDTEEARQELARRLVDQRETEFLSIGPGRYKDFVFDGLGPAREADRPITVRYRISAGDNDPRDEHRLTFHVEGQRPIVQSAPPNQTLTLSFFPGVIAPDGTLTLRVMNADIEQGFTRGRTVVFPPDGLEVYYGAGSYRMNFARVAVVLWLKLAMLAMVAIVASTFLSFPVASLVAFGVFLMAEGARFLWDSLESYGSTDTEGNIIFYKVIVRAIAVPVSLGFRFYADLKPTAQLVEGRLLPWATVVIAAAVLGGASAVLFGVGVAIFRRRELATYSGA